MNESPHSLNPVPFVGREDIFAKIHQHFIDAQSPLAFTILGGHGMGKTALLQHYVNIADDSTIGIYIPLKSDPVQTEIAVWLKLMEAIHQVMITRTYMEGRLPSPSDEVLEDELLFWAWFQDRFIVALLRIIRPHRRLVLVMDDLHLLTTELPQEHVQSFIDHLSRLLQMSKQILMVTTLPLYAEDLLLTFRTIVQDSTSVVRLSYLSLAEVHQCMDAIGTEAEESVLTTLYTLTGGHPWLLSDYLRYTLADDARPPYKDIQGSMKALQTRHDRFFQTLWETLNEHEQTLLHTIADLHHQNDEAVIHFSMLEKWLLESDINLEAAVIRATTRSLEYQQMITQDENGFRIVVRLFQAWIIRQRPTPQKTQKSSLRLRNRILFLLGLIGLLILLVVLIIRIQQTPRIGEEFVNPSATVTLGN